MEMHFTNEVIIMLGQIYHYIEYIGVNKCATFKLIPTPNF